MRQQNYEKYAGQWLPAGSNGQTDHDKLQMVFILAWFVNKRELWVWLLIC